MIKTGNKIKVNLNTTDTSLKINNSPISFRNIFKTSEIDFNDIIWLYWDWDDWCQYWEVIASSDDIKAFENSKNSTWSVEALSFLKDLK